MNARAGGRAAGGWTGAHIFPKAHIFHSKAHIPPESAHFPLESAHRPLESTHLPLESTHRPLKLLQVTCAILRPKAQGPSAGPQGQFGKALLRCVREPQAVGLSMRDLVRTLCATCATAMAVQVGTGFPQYVRDLACSKKHDCSML